MGVSCVLAAAIAAAIAACAAGTSKNAPVDSPAGAVCGDGVCTPQEIETCPQDCGSQGSGSGTGSGSSQLDAGVQVTVDAGSGSGSGSGSLNCNNPVVIFECEACVIGDCSGGTTVAACDVCLGI
jgi:hypothetical protein